MLVGGAASADLKLKWDCYLPGSRVDCVALESSLTSMIPFLKTVAARTDADVVVTLTSSPAENGARFNFDFEGRPVDGYVTSVHTTDKIPYGIDGATTTVRILTKLERGLDDFMDQQEAAEVKDGKLDLQLSDPARSPFTGRPEQNSVKWYVVPSVGTYWSNVVGVGLNASGSASVSFNYSLARWRLQQWIGANYTQQSQPVPGTTETASIRFAGGAVSNVLSRDLTADHRWSVGVLLAGEKNPQANYETRANGSAGIEFDAIPRQTVDQKNLGFRCAVGAELQRYDATNLQGLDEQIVARQFCDVFFNWHFAPIDLSASLGETAVLEDLDYRSFSAGLSATWRVTDNFTVSPWVAVQQINQAINEARATNVVYTDPRQEIEASMRAAVERGYTSPFGVQSGLAIKFIFGNGSLSSEDQRWKNATSLR